MSAQTATSPANFSPAICAKAGNDNTSVGLSLPPNLRFKNRISLLPVTRRLTVPFNPTTRRARSTKRSSIAPLSPAIRLFKVTICSPRPLPPFSANPAIDFFSVQQRICVRAGQNKQEGPIQRPPAWNLHVIPQFRFPPVTRQRPARFLFQGHWTFRWFVHRLPRLLHFHF